MPLKDIKNINDLIKTPFLEDNWGLETELARELYKHVVLPFRNDHGIVDAHTHFSAKQIIENKPISDIFSAMVLETDERWSNRDHYIVQLLAGEGIPFDFWYGPAKPKDKWMAMAKVFPNLVNTQVYKWTHMELNQILGIECLLNEKNAERIWNEANRKLKQPEYSPQALLSDAGVKVLATTDDPADDLPSEGDSIISRPDGNKMAIIPTYRPDKAMNIEAEGWAGYVNKLCDKAASVHTLDGLLAALKKRHDYFAEAGCRASDHGLLEPFGYVVEQKDAQDAFNRVYQSRAAVSKEDIRVFKSFLMHKFCEWDKEKGWATQIHFAALRDQNEHLAELAGPNSGGDYGQQHMDIATHLHDLLNKYAATGDPKKDGKIVLYSLSPSHYPQIAQMLTAFPGAYYGEGWWFNDSIEGMGSYHNIMNPTLAHTRNAGMVCDGRKPISMWPRHDTRDRVLCNEFANAAIHGGMPIELVERTLYNLMYHNQVRIFGLEKALKKVA